MAVSKLLEGAFKAIDTANKEKERLRKAKVDALKARDKDMPKPNDTAKLTTARPKMIKDDQENEDLQELSKKTLGSYIKKAHYDKEHQRDAEDENYEISHKLGKANFPSGSERHRKKAMAHNLKHQNRSHGINQAADKLSKEDLQELSKKTLGSYVKKATSKVRDGAYVAGLANNDDEQWSRAKFGKVSKRAANIERATDKLAKEDTSPLEIDADDSDKEKAAKKKHNDAVKDIKENMTVPSSKTIIEILASGNPQHRLKEATFSVLSQRAGVALDQFKQVIAKQYFGQSLDEAKKKVVVGDNIKVKTASNVKPGSKVTTEAKPKPGEDPDLDAHNRRVAAKDKGRDDPAAGESNWTGGSGKPQTKKAKREADHASKARWATDPKSETYWSS